jgi:hypothetical protein
MSRNGSGVYTLPAGNPVIAGTTIATSWANNTLNDLASAMTGSVASDGQTPMTGNLNLNNNNINNVASLTAAGNISTLNLSYTGTLTGGTGVINIGSGQIYKDASGNVGLGVTPNAWATTNSVKALQTSSGALWNFSTNFLYLGQNYYWNGTNRIYINTDGATEYQQNAGTHIWSTAPSGTAGTTATLSERMRIDSSGNVGIGTSSIASTLDVFRASDATQYVRTANVQVYTQANDSSASGVFGTVTSHPMRFISSNVERMRINAAGGISIGTTTASPTSGILLPINGIINTDGGTLYSYSVRDTTTASAANTFIDPTDGFLARSTSSIKYKTNVEDIEPSKYKSIYEMRPVWYRSIGERDRKDWSYYGLIAEEVGEVDPRLVHWAKKEDGTLEAEGVMYERLTVLLLAELKEIKIELNSVKAELALLKA